MTNSIIDQDPAVSVQITDFVWLWQSGQSPPSRRAPLSEVNAFSLPLTGGTVTGKTTFTVSGTAVAINNNATVGGTLLVTGAVTYNGGATLSADGGWSTANVGKQLLITTPAGKSNPAIGFTDSAGTNLIGIYNTTGTLSLSAMPAYSDAATGPTTIATLTKDAVTITGTLKTSKGVTVTSGGVVVTAGDVTVTAGGVAVTAGNVTLGAGTVSLPNNTAVQFKDKGGTSRSTLGVNSSNDTFLANAGGGNLSLTKQDGTSLLTTTDAGVFGLTGSLTISTDATSGRLVPNYSQFAPTLGNPGALANPGGFLEKWGSITSDAFGAGTVTFAVAFPTATDSVSLQLINGKGIGASVDSGYTKSGFAVSVYDTTTGSAVGAHDIFWTAIGH